MKEINKAKLVKIIIKSIDWHTMMLPRTKINGNKWTKSELTKAIANYVADDILILIKQQ